MSSLHESSDASDTSVAGVVRDPLGDDGAVLAARQRPMSERLELALSWNSVAAELRLGLSRVTAADKQANPSR